MRGRITPGEYWEDLEEAVKLLDGYGFFDDAEPDYPESDRRSLLLVGELADRFSNFFTVHPHIDESTFITAWLIHKLASLQVAQSKLTDEIEKLKAN